MFNSVFSRVGNSGAWRRAAIELCELPVEGDPHEFNHRLLTVAGGIALVLSRCPKGMEKKHYPATAELYALIRAGMRRKGRADPHAELLLDSFHEVSGKLDPASRLALRQCLERQRDLERRTHPAKPASRRAPVPDNSRATLSPSGIEVLEEQENPT